MAAKKFTSEEEREKFIIEIADYFIENSSSTRKTALKFNISNFTAHEYLISKLSKIDLERYIKVMEIINNNKSKTKYDKNIEKRLNDIYNCIFINNMTVLNTSKILNISEKTIYNDIFKFDKIRFINIKMKLKEHSMGNSPYIK